MECNFTSHATNDLTNERTNERTELTENLGNIELKELVKYSFTEGI